MLVAERSLTVKKSPSYCALCGDLLVEVEAALNRSSGTITGNSSLEIRLAGKSWVPFMNEDRSAQGLYCTRCGALTIAPSLSRHRKELGLDP